MKDEALKRHFYFGPAKGNAFQFGGSVIYHEIKPEDPLRMIWNLEHELTHSYGALFFTWPFYPLEINRLFVSQVSELIEEYAYFKKPLPLPFASAHTSKLPISIQKKIDAILKSERIRSWLETSMAIPFEMDALMRAITVLLFNKQPFIEDLKIDEATFDRKIAELGRLETSSPFEEHRLALYGNEKIIERYGPRCLNAAIILSLAIAPPFNDSIFATDVRAIADKISKDNPQQRIQMMLSNSKRAVKKNDVDSFLNYFRKNYEWTVKLPKELNSWACKLHADGELSPASGQAIQEHINVKKRFEKIAKRDDREAIYDPLGKAINVMGDQLRKETGLNDRLAHLLTHSSFHNILVARQRRTIKIFVPPMKKSLAAVLETYFENDFYPQLVHNKASQIQCPLASKIVRCKYSRGKPKIVYENEQAQKMAEIALRNYCLADKQKPCRFFKITGMPPN